MWGSVLKHRANRVIENPESVKNIEASDVCKAFDEMIANRKPKMSEEEQMKRKFYEAALARRQPKPRPAVNDFLMLQLSITQIYKWSNI